MSTLKVRRSDGYRCFYCNARVEESAERCPECGREFGVASERTRKKPRRLGDRVHEAAEGRRRSYRLAVIVLLVAVVVLVALFRPRRFRKPLLAEPPGPRPEFTIVETWELPQGKLDRLSVVALVRPGLEHAELRSVLDWTLYSLLDERNREGGRYFRVVWVYAVEDSLARKTDWRAMAIWIDPALGESKRPAGIGGDAITDGPVEYDFTNNYRSRAEEFKDTGGSE